MSEHPLQGVIDVAMQRIREMVDSNTIIGKPIMAKDGTTVLPVSKITYGFASGGSDISSKTPKDLFGGGSGAGVSISPVAFLVIRSNGDVRLIQLTAQNAGTAERVIDAIPGIVDKVQDMVGKKKKPGSEAK